MLLKLTGKSSSAITCPYTWRGESETCQAASVLQREESASVEIMASERTIWVKERF
jgi:hypothetical protein